MAMSRIQNPAGPTKPSVIFLTHENTSSTANEPKSENEGLRLEMTEPEEHHTFQSDPTSITTDKTLVTKVKKLEQEIFLLKKDRLSDQSHFQEIISRLERKNTELDRRNRMLTQRDDERTTKFAELNGMSKRRLTDAKCETEDIMQYIHTLSKVVHNHWPNNGAFVREKTNMNNALDLLRESLWQIRKITRQHK